MKFTAKQCRMSPEEFISLKIHRAIVAGKTGHGILVPLSLLPNPTHLEGNKIVVVKPENHNGGD